MEAKNSPTVAFGLLCGLALCCAVMYITADGSELMAEDMHPAGFDSGNPADASPPLSIESVDVKKSAVIITDTPDGRMELMTYLLKVEEEIAKERAQEDSAIDAIRAKMAKNRAYNAKARSDMKAVLLKKMAENAKKAKDELASNMREVQAKFAQQAAIANKRWKKANKRFKKTRAIMAKNKKEASRALKMAVKNQQEALSTLDAATNSRIKSTEKSIAANSAQIKENAKKARHDLDLSMSAFDKKMDNVQAEAKAGRSKLAAQAATQDKAFREYANNRIKTIAENTAAEFRKVRAKMAKDRHNADMAVKQAASRLDASLSAQQAIQDDRFKKTVSDIEGAKKEADERVAAAKKQFNTDIGALQTRVSKQVQQLNAKQTALSGEITHNKLEQAKVNKNVNAELKRMVKLGNDRYMEHVKKNADLKDLLAKNKEDTEKKMQDLSSEFTEGMGKIREQMKKDRAHAKDQLEKKTNTLFQTLTDNAVAQDKVNAELSASTEAAKKAAEEALSNTKDDFANKLAAMHKTAILSAQKQEAKIAALTGVVAENALKDAEGRAQLKKVQDSNKEEISNAIHEAITAGENHARKVMADMKKLNDKTRSQMSMKINTEIGDLRKQTQKALYKLELDSKEARAVMKKQVQAALADAVKQTKQDLSNAVTWATGRFAELDEALEAAAEKSEAERKVLQTQITADKEAAKKRLQNAVDAQSRAVLAVKAEADTKISKANTKLQNLNKEMQDNAKAASDQIKADVASLTGKVADAKKAAEEQLGTAQAASAKRYQSALDEVNAGLEAARVHSEKRFGEVYTKMAQDREELSSAYKTNLQQLNDALAANAALQNQQFTEKLPKAIAEYQADAMERVSNAKKAMKTSIVALTAKIKDSETRIQGEIGVISGEIISQQAAQARVNKKVAAQLEAIEETSNQELSTSKRFHKELKVKVDADKAAAAEEVRQLAEHTKTELALTRSKMAEYRELHATQLTKATEGLYSALKKHEETQAGAHQGLKSQLATSEVATASKLKDAKADFHAKLETLTNRVTADHAKYEKKMEKVTGVVMDWKKASTEDRELIKTHLKAMDDDLNKGIVRAIQQGEAKIKEVESSAIAATNQAGKETLTLISETVEDMADDMFAMLQEDRGTVADNYLSFKAYAVAAKDDILDYIKNGKSRNLASVGDLLKSVGALENIRPSKVVGLGGGLKEIKKVFSGGAIKIKNPTSKVNSLVDEYSRVLSEVQMRWQMGIGKYLLARLEGAMQKKGVLEVDKIEGKAGNYVFMNGHAVGLSSKLSDFEQLAVHMPVYEDMLTKLTKKIATPKPAIPQKKAMEYLKGGEWDGK